MATEQYSIGYEEGFQNGWNAAVDSLPAQRKPLTDEQIIASNYPDGEENGPTIAAPDFELICFARQIEAAHGIKENT